MNILVTGSNGQLGNELQLQYKKSTHNWFFTDIRELDITDEDAVNNYVTSNSIDGIVNCAAYTAVEKAENDIPFCKELNATAPAKLARAIEKRNGWLIQISTDYVFDGHSHAPYTENDVPSPVNIYGKTKLEGEISAAHNCTKTLIIRTAWLYSTFGNNFVKSMIKLGNERDRLSVVYDQIGTPTYACDLAEAIISIIEKGVQPGVYHYSNEGTASWYDFAKAIHRIAGVNNCRVCPVRSEEYPTIAKRPHYSVLDKSKIKSAYDMEIPYWETSLDKCIKKLLSNE